MLINHSCFYDAASPDNETSWPVEEGGPEFNETFLVFLNKNGVNICDGIDGADIMN